MLNPAFTDCLTEINVFIEADEGPNAIVSTTPANCDDTTGSATLFPVDFEYLWEDGFTGNTRADLSSGSYYVTVTDPGIGDCENVILVTINEENALQAELEILNLPGCNLADGSVQLNVTGGSGNYSFDWPGGSNIQTGLAAGFMRY